MEDVTDPPFRSLCKDQGADMMYTEFISSEGLIRHGVKSTKKLDISDDERPIGIQIFGNNIDSMTQSVGIIESSQPDLIDINYGCPVKKVVSKGGGAAILKDIPQMVHLTSEMVKISKLPVTVKTRLGWDDDTKHIVEVTERLQDVGIQGITIHGRTGKQMFKGKADWSLIGEIKNNPRIKIPVFGNGDVDSAEKATEMRSKYGVDGIMIGRGAIGYPWIFREIKHFFKTGKKLSPPTIEERTNVCRLHLQRAMEWKGERTGILEMRKHYTNYFRSLPYVKPYRTQLVSLESFEEIDVLFNNMDSVYKGIEEPS